MELDKVLLFVPADERRADALSARARGGMPTCESGDLLGLSITSVAIERMIKLFHRTPYL